MGKKDVATALEGHTGSFRTIMTGNDANDEVDEH